MIKLHFYINKRDLASLNPIIKEVERTKGFKPLLFVGGTYLYKIMAIPSKKFKRKTKSLWIL